MPFSKRCFSYVSGIVFFITSVWKNVWALFNWSYQILRIIYYQKHGFICLLNMLLFLLQKFYFKVIKKKMETYQRFGRFCLVYVQKTNFIYFRYIILLKNNCWIRIYHAWDKIQRFMGPKRKRLRQIWRVDVLSDKYLHYLNMFQTLKNASSNIIFGAKGLSYR